MGKKDLVQLNKTTQERDKTRSFFIQTYLTSLGQATDF